MKSVRILCSAIAALGIALLGFGCGDDDGGGDSGSSGELTKVTFVDAAPFKIDLYPFNVAKELGYFEDEGLDVQLEPVDGTELAFKQVAAGRAQFGYGASEGILLGASEFPDSVKAFYDIYNTGTFQIYAPQDSGITSTADLAGKSIGVEAPNTGEAVFTRITLANAGVNLDDVDLVPVGEETANELSALDAGRVDAVTGPLDTEVGAEVNDMPLTCLTCDAEQPASSGLFVNAEFAEQNPDLVTAFGRAIARATAFGEDNQERVLEIMEEVAPEQFTEPDFPQAALTAALEELDRDEGQLGAVTVEDWELQMEYMMRPEAQEASLEQPVDLNQLLITDLTEQINDFDAGEEPPKD